MPAMIANHVESGPAKWEPNPLVAHVRSLGLAVNGEPPTLFESGACPPYLASGLDPEILARAPAAVRHPIARATSTAEARRLLAEYVDPCAAGRAARDFADDPGNARYRDRVLSWVEAPSSELVLGAEAWI